MLLLVLTLTGCVHADRSVQLNADGSGSYTFTLGFSDQVLSLGGSNFKSQMNTCGESVKAHGGSYRQFEEAGYGNWAFTWPFKSVASLNQLIQDSTSLCNTAGSSSSSSGGLSANPTDYFKVTESRGFFANTFHATGSMSMVDQSSTPDPSSAQLLKDARESFAITFPSFVGAHTGGVVHGNTITYTVHYNEATTIDATGGGYNVTGFLSVGALALVLLLGAIVAWLYVRRRNAFATMEPVPVAAGTEYASGFGLPSLASDAPTLPPMPSDPSTPPSPTDPTLPSTMS
jgi:hypothetical protein